jgi:hypothetical protein
MNLQTNKFLASEIFEHENKITTEISLETKRFSLNQIIVKNNLSINYQSSEDFIEKEDIIDYEYSADFSILKIVGLEDF